MNKSFLVQEEISITLLRINLQSTREIEIEIM